MAEIEVPIDYLAKKLNIAAIRGITSKVEKIDLKPFEVDTNLVLETRQRRRPMNLNKTKMPKEFFENMVSPTNDQTDNGYSNGFAKSIISSSQERDPSQNDFDRMRQINERLSNKSYPTSSPVNQQTNNNGFGQISEQQIRSLIKEEVYKILNEIIDKEGENRLLSEQIQIKIGSTIFSGKLSPIMNKMSIIPTLKE